MTMFYLKFKEHGYG